MAKIIGGTAASNMLIPDWNQTNPSRADYIKNKPEIVPLSYMEAAYTKIPRTDALEKRIVNLEQGVTPSPFVTDNTMAYSKDVPLNALPYAEVSTVGGMTRKCTNLCKSLDSSYSAYGHTVTRNDDGSITVSGAVTKAGEVILNLANQENAILNAGESYTYTYSTNTNNKCSVRIDYTDTAGGTCWGWSSQDISRPRKLSKVYLQITNAEVGDTSLNGTYRIMLNEGSTALPYEQYFEGFRSAPVTEIKSVGINLLDSIGEDSQYYVGHYYCNPDGGYNANKDQNAFIIPVVSGEQYYLTSTRDTLSVAAIWHYLDSNKKRISQDASGYSTKYIIKTIPEDACYIRFSVGIATLNAGYQFCINKSDTAINGEVYPYWESTFAIPKAVQALDGYGEGVSDTCYNYVDFENKQFVKRVGKRVVSESESALELYELETPEVTDISDILSDDNYIQVEGGGTITFRNEYEYDVPSEITYQIKEVAV